jgi:D-alanyl-lipoteichoic acid acyltransferase DltB (MBOAT superfamily)
VVFNSFQYVVFLPVVLGLYWLLKHRQQNALLLAASYVFYGAWDYRFLGLMMLSTITDFTVGRLLEATEDDRRRKRIFLVSLGVNLGILGFFKYFNFFADSFASLLRQVGFEAHAPTLRILLPIGISFYTFHGISYTFDVYRRHITPTRNLLDFAVFISFFPQLVAGPIGRAHIQLPQFERPRSKPTAEQWRSGLFLIFLGLFKKVAIADALAPFVERAFSSADTASWATLLAGVYAFAFQIYGDFSGYSDMARGSSRLFGIELLRNFEQPYLSRNITQFWRTWHISLSTWLRDYLYVALGGNRKGKLATYGNLMITMLLGGLWHGANWTFVVWGGLHGLFLTVHRRFGRRDAVERAPTFRLRDVLPALGTFHLVCLAWVFFRAETFHQAFNLLVGIASFRGLFEWTDAFTTLALGGTIMLAIDLIQRNRHSETAILEWSPPARGLVYATFVVLIIMFSGGTPVPFIYFQF